MKKTTKIAVTVAAMSVMVLGTTMMSSAAELKNTWDNQNGRWVYYNSNGDKVSNSWVKAGDDWYFLDDEGYMATKSFIRTDHFSSNSEVLNDDDIHDLLDDDDIDDDSDFFYVNADGKMVTGWNQIKVSDFSSAPNSTKDGKVWYYFGTSGVMYAHQWIQSGSDWYALKPNGQMYTNAIVNRDLDNETTSDWYYIDGSGKMRTGWYKTVQADDDANTIKKDKWIYAYEDGTLAMNEWVHAGSHWYYIGKNSPNNSTYMGVVMYGTNEAVAGDPVVSSNAVSGSGVSVLDVTSGDSEYYNHDMGSATEVFSMLEDNMILWNNKDSKGGKAFYLRPDNGFMVSGWYEYDDDYYLFGKDNGELLVGGVKKANGKYYYFDEDYICDYKNINNVADYCVEVKNTDDDIIATYFYDINKRAESDDVENLTIAEMRDSLIAEYYYIGTRRVQRKSLTDTEVILAYTAEDKGYLGSSNKLNVYKLRTSSAVEKKQISK